MNRAIYIAAGVLGFIAVVFYAIRWWPEAPEATVEELAVTAVEAKVPEVRQQAATRLQAQGKAAAPQLREVLKTSKDPAVRAASVQGLGAVYDYEHMDDLFAALEDESPKVRFKAGIAITRMIGRNYYFDANAPEAERAKKIKRMRADWEGFRGTPLFQYWQEQLQKKQGSS